MDKISQHGQWSSRLTFILAATGSAVGLGNIWKFPYITGENGGGAFVLVYLLCILAIGIPIMMAEVMLGRRGRQSPVNTMRDLAKEAGSTPFWSWLGWLGVIAGFLILSYYSVIAGWAMAYVVRVASGVFEGATADGVSNIFGQFIADPEKLLAWHSLFMIITMLVVARGVKGLERAVTFLMPALLVILLLLVGYSVNQGAFQEGVAFLFTPDFSKINSDGILTAMGHAFFTLSLGMGAIMVYGSYLPGKVSIGSTVIIIALADTAVALLAGLVIFPIVFANGLEPGSGPGLIFQTLPIAFGHMAYGAFFGTLFFVLLVFAAWSSSISLIEPAVAWLVENKKMSRMRACIWAGLVTWVFGIGTVLSFNVASDIKLFDKTFFDTLDYLTANIMLPLGGLFIALFAGWVMKKEMSANELSLKYSWLYNVWRFLIRFVSPAAVIIVFLNVIGLI
ncbi:MAG: sodium-dependent transporter [Piscirickettsiaceae bacterium]|nr:MAG: sodium-dependent transporter [Piscirickettsiaceae bacterium]PCI68065.1 MAG: sodium-dependent transporter [Piscirickettsiaceae bacterium]